MRISAKGRYALSAAVVMAQQYSVGEYITVITISERLKISKIYLEQVFSLMKRSGLVISFKGAQGGYQLARMPEQITVMDIFSAVETWLFEKTEDTIPDSAPEIEMAIRLSAFDILDKCIKDTLNKITLSDIVYEVEKSQKDNTLMFYI